jgi:type II secretory ATPase GspE/PulE/Tfp pilus assembly ATPase PilB-like protein
MSDLSLPPLSLVLPHQATPGMDAPTAPNGPFRWPVPRDAGLGPPMPLAGAEPAELEGPNGTVTLCRLLAVKPDAGTVEIQTSSSRGALKLKLTQFRRITLLRPLKPADDGAAAGHAKALRGQLQLVRIQFRDGHASEVKSVGHIEQAIGHFTFSPLNAQGHLLRSFYPRPMVTQLALIDLGRPSVERVLAAAAAATKAATSTGAGSAAMPPAAPPAQLAAATIKAAQGPAPGRGKALAPGVPRLADALPALDFKLNDGAAAPEPAAPRTQGALPPLPHLPHLSLADTPPAATPSGRPRSTAATPPAGLARLPELTEVVTLPDAPAFADSTPGGQRSISDILQMHQISTPPQLLEAIEQQARMPMVRIGEALMALGFITEQKLGDALQAQSRDRSLPLGELLVRRGDVSRSNLQTALARKMGYPVVNATAFPTEPEAVRRLPLALARRLPALPLMMSGGRLVVALEDPSARPVIDEIEFNAQCKVVPVLARAGTLLGAIEGAYLQFGKDTIDPSDELRFNLGGMDGDHNTDKLLADLELDSGDGSDDGPVIETSDNSLVRLINTMILEARQLGVSDIHIECPPSPQKVKVRFRRDGVLRPHLELPPSYRQAIVARIKIMCDLDISERRKPQDGKIAFGRFMQGHRLELRVATIPTANGLEDVVLRLLSSAKALPLDSMGLAPDVLSRLRSTVERPYGLVLCVGPTGSGKTTTLHAALAHINTPERKIWTAEDPVEITQPGLRQVQVNAKIDWTFAKALRAFLRADPDVVMVGEVRDEETAQMAIEASLTGHLVLSTLHTNSASETVTRLLDMGMDPFSFADSLLAVLAQRLVRRWCTHCVESRPAAEDDVQTLLSEYLQAYPDSVLRPDRDALLARWRHDHGREGTLMQYHAPGCNECGGTGYEGRLGLHELMVVSRELRQQVQQKAPARELLRQAMADGMRTLRQDGILKVLAGQTSIEEVRAISNL